MFQISIIDCFDIVPCTCSNSGGDVLIFECSKPKMATLPLQFDTAIYQESSTNVKCSEHRDCKFVRRLLTALSYYTHLITTNSTNDKLIFNNFMDSIYKHKVYDDFYHVTKKHQNEIISIMNLCIEAYKVPKCDLTCCLYSDRHFEVSTQNISKSNINQSNHENAGMKYFFVYQEVMDSLHFYVYHLLDTASRLAADESDNKKPAGSSYSDRELSRILDMRKKCSEKTARFIRLKTNVAHIMHVHTDDYKDYIESNGTSDTFLDAIYNGLLSTSSNEQTVTKLVSIIQSGDYDTESVDMDLDIFEETKVSNVSIALSNDALIQQILNRFQQCNSLVRCYLFLSIPT